MRDGNHRDADGGEHDGERQHLLTGQQFRGGRDPQACPDEPARPLLADQDLVQGEQREWREDRDRHVDLPRRSRDHPWAEPVQQARDDGGEAAADIPAGEQVNGPSRER